MERELGGENEDAGQAVVQRRMIARNDLYWDREKRIYRYGPTRKETNADRALRHCIITVTRHMEPQGTFKGDCTVTLRAPLLCEKLSSILPHAETSFQGKVTLRGDDIKLLFHAFPQLKDAHRNAGNHPGGSTGDLILELEAALTFTKDHFKDDLAEIDKLPTRQIKFDYLWSLFPPGVLIYAVDDLGEGRVYRALRSGKRKDRDGLAYYGIDTNHIDYDGENYGWVESELKISFFSGLAVIWHLSACPLARHPYYDSVKHRIIERSEKALKLRCSQIQEYQGFAIDDWGKKFNSHGRVMIDPAAYRRFLPNSTQMPRIISPIKDRNLDEEEKLILHSVVYGFSLGDKTWGSFAVSGLRAVTWNEEAIELLVLPPEQKLFIQKLVESHGPHGDGEFDDIVREKGKGLVGLLAGPPGVGKTVTAETVAEVAHYPLYTLNSGELGDTATSVERKLFEVMGLVETWNAVLLIDEADVFLAERDNSSLTRNAITSIFLRHIEYFKGILLLTTNRLKSFDPAFASRVHFTFKYKDLEADGRERIWATFLDRARRVNGLQVAVSKDEIKFLATMNLNGRLIKNIVSTSQAFATRVGKPLSLETIRLATGFAYETVEWPPEHNGSGDTSAKRRRTS